MAAALAKHSLRVAIDASQFLVRGSEPTDFFDDVLLARASQAPPSHSDTVSMLVLTPHQYNFDTAIDIEVWNQRPSDDRQHWDQVSESRLEVDRNGLLRVESPMLDPAICNVPPGRYMVEASGRGFITYGWPGSTEPGDVWRIRLWPDDGAPMLSPKLWNRPDAPHVDAADMVSAPLHYGTVTTSTQVSGLDKIVIKPDFSANQIADDPVIKAIAEIPGGVYLFALDPGLTSTIVDLNSKTLRQIAIWAAGQACTSADILARRWVQDALSQTSRNIPPDLSDHYESIREQPDPRQPQRPALSLFSYPTLHRALTKPFDYSDPQPRHRAAFAVAAIAATGHSPALVAAVEAIHLTCLATEDQGSEIRKQLLTLLPEDGDTTRQHTP